MSGFQDGDESDVDCGGSCAPCAGGKQCLHGVDCESGSCTNNVCDAPACNDGRKNGAESDLDCGGGCPPCADGKACNQGSDCQSATCNNNLCKPTPCSNGVRDGAETDVDCGGGTCGPCADGKVCNGGGDCLSGVCNNNVCKGAVQCMDGKIDGSETDIDCGGGSCPTCANGKACLVGPDCQSGSCVNRLCVGKAATLSFGAPVMITVPQIARFREVPLVCDVNGDKKLDVFARGESMQNQNQSGFAFIAGKGDGTFQAPSVQLDMNGDNPLVAGDLNGDGKADFLSLRGSWISALGDGMGGFTKVTGLDVARGDALLSDLDGDGKLDAVQFDTGTYYAALGKGDGTFASLKPSNAKVYYGRGWAIDDMNRDGKPDNVMGGSDSMSVNQLGIALGKGDGFFDLDSPVKPDAIVSRVSTGDFNGDGKRDVLSVETNNNNMGQFEVLAGDGKGGLAAAVLTKEDVGNTPVVADFNLDGKSDIAFSYPKVAVYLSKGDGTFQAPVMLAALAYGIAGGDFNKDGKPDLVLIDGTNVVRVYLNTSK